MDWMALLLPVAVAIVASVPGVLAYANARMAIRREQEDSAQHAWQALLLPLRERNAELEQLRIEMEAAVHDLRLQIGNLTLAQHRLQAEAAGLERRMMAYYRQLVDAHLTPDPNYQSDLELSPAESAYSSVAAQVEQEMAEDAAKDAEIAALRQQLKDAGIESGEDSEGAQ